MNHPRTQSINDSVSAQMVCTRLHSFGFAERSGAYPEAAVVQGRDGAFYGTTAWGGSTNEGTIFKVNPDGTGHTILYSFTRSGGDGAWPKAGLVQGSDGAFYGTTAGGGDSDLGTVFRIGPNRAPSLLCTTAARLPCSPSAGFDVTVPVEVSDPDGQELTVSWNVDGTVQTVPAGDRLTTASLSFTSVFAPGTHTVTFTVSDGITSCTCQTTITIEADTTPPRLACPPNQTVTFADETGARVEFQTPTALDDCSGPVPVSCVPASGNLFPIGTTLVLGTADDDAGNQATCSFTITVLGARGLKEAVLADLLALRAMARPREAGRFGEAIEAVRRSLTARWWVDETHLAPNGGDQVFNAEKEAIQKLGTLLQTKQGQSADAGLAGSIQRLARADRLLAVVALLEAGNESARPHRLDLAAKTVALGDQAVAQGQYLAGIEHYRNAWKHALGSK